MALNQRRKKITWCAGLDPPCKIGMHPRVDHINKAMVDGDIDTVAAHFDVDIHDLNRHAIDGHHLPWDDPNNKVRQGKEKFHDEQNADRDDVLQNMEELVTAPHKYYPKMQKILTRIIVDRLNENSAADISKFSKEVRENFRAMSELPISEDIEINIKKEYDFFFNIVETKVCSECQLIILGELERYRRENPVKADVQREEARQETQKELSKAVIKKVDLRLKKNG